MRKVLIWRKSAYYGKWRICHLRYSLYSIDSNVSSISSDKLLVIEINKK